MAEYGGRLYDNVQSMADRASAPVTMSRAAEDPAWQDNPSIDAMIDSTFLCIGTHYYGRTNTRWSFCNEAMVCCKFLQIYRKDPCRTLSTVNLELCKRVFCVLYTFQCFDRFVLVTPHTLLAFLPAFLPDDIDWGHLQLAEVTDDELSSILHHTSSSHYPAPIASRIALISGFIAYIVLFQRLRQITSIPLSCQSPYELFPEGCQLGHDNYPLTAD
ncbi:hypothetical protein BJX65DRAFT_314426 [Aspergillus insuetus]